MSLGLHDVFSMKPEMVPHSYLCLARNEGMEKEMQTPLSLEII